MASEYLGYNYAGPVGQVPIPQRLQNLCIRDYAQSKKLVLLFSAAEYFDSGQSLMLFAQFEHWEKIAGLIFYSIQLLPSDHERRARLYRRVLESGKELHFALEDLSMSTDQEQKRIERIYRLSIDPRLNITRQRLLALHGQNERS